MRQPHSVLLPDTEEVIWGCTPHDLQWLEVGIKCDIGSQEWYVVFNIRSVISLVEVIVEELDDGLRRLSEGPPLGYSLP